MKSLMAGDREFARFLRIEAALTSEDIMALAQYKRMHISYTGPWEDVSLKALGGYAPSALQTDILPRSRVGDMHSPCYAMMSSEVRAASKRKNQANSQSPTMRDSVYEVESPWLGTIY